MQELTQQLEEQRAMYTRRIRALEAKLTTAQGVAAIASRRDSASSSASGRPSAAKSRPLGRVGLRPGASAADRGELETDNMAAHVTATGVSSESGNPHIDVAMAAVAEASVDNISDTQDSGDGGINRSAAASAGLLRMKERQITGLMAQLEERTSQVGFCTSHVIVCSICAPCYLT